jgi:hypothetical protein
VTAASFSDWAAAGFLGLSAIGLIALALAFADADLAYFDPRPLLDTGLGARVLVEIVGARYTARDALVAVALLLSPASAPKGATR